MRYYEISERFQSQNPTMAGGATAKFKKAKDAIQELEEDDDKTCPTCQGRGSIDNDDTCHNCGGAGTVPPTDQLEEADAVETNEADKTIRFLERLLTAPRGAVGYRKDELHQIHTHYQHLSKSTNYSEKGKKIKELLDLVNEKLRWENSHAADVQPPRWLPDSSLTMEDESEDTLHPPSISKGDEVKVGKFKNSKATVKGFKKDDHNQPVLKTNKGDKKLFNLRLSKIQPK